MCADGESINEKWKLEAEGKEVKEMERMSNPQSKSWEG